MSARRKRWLTIAYWVTILPVAFLAGWVWGYPWEWFGWVPDLFPPPEPPPPPDWLDRLAAQGIEHAAPYLYWALFIFHLVIWEILRWQRNVPESGAARWFRRFLMAKAFLWLTLAVGRTLLQEWLIVGYAAVVLYVSLATGLAMLALLWTYVVPVIRCRGGRCEPVITPTVNGLGLPGTWNPVKDGERRSGKERRRDWPPKPTLN